MTVVNLQCNLQIRAHTFCLVVVGLLVYDMSQRLCETMEKPIKDEVLQSALSQIEHMHGKGSIMRLGASQVPDSATVISTGSLGLDAALGIGGIPRGRIAEIYGPEASGKTTLSLKP